MRTWRILQTAVWIIGVLIVVLLFAAPAIGIHGFWNVLIPVAPALLAVAPGLWRNICPMASNALFSRHKGWSAARRIPAQVHPWLLLGGVVLLYAIVPLRHVVLDTNGPATAVTILALAAVAIVMGSRFEWKSGWCSGLCPVHPVERLYGSSPAPLEMKNAHCESCHKCVAVCADSTTAMDPSRANGSRIHTLVTLLMIGGFPGFIWGWFQVPDYAGAEGWRHLGQAYGWPLLGAAVSLAAYLLLMRTTLDKVFLRRLFAAAAISCYYWYRLPALFGFGPFPGDGMLVDLRATLPAAFPIVSRIATTLLFAWWIIGRRNIRRAWAQRPSYAEPLTTESPSS